MFRGGSYVDNKEFKDHENKPGYNYMNVEDIPGAKPKKLFQSRLNSMQNVGQNIMTRDNLRMVPAGAKNIAPKGQRSINDCWSMGDYRMESKQDRNVLATQDINGLKKNQYGHIMRLPER